MTPQSTTPNEDLREKINEINKRYGATWDIPDELWKEILALLDEEILKARIKELEMLPVMRQGLHTPQKELDIILADTVRQRIKELQRATAKEGK